MDETAPITVEPSQTYDDVPVEDDIPEEGSEHDGENAAASAPKKPKPKPPTERPPGASLLPMSRVQKIMKADKELAGTAKEAVFLISVATVRI
jgi:DNA polymerase epsilon subunit 4